MDLAMKKNIVRAVLIIVLLLLTVSVPPEYLNSASDSNVVLGISMIISNAILFIIVVSGKKFNKFLNKILN